MLHLVQAQIDQLAQQYDCRRSSVFDVHVVLTHAATTVYGVVLEPAQHAAVLAIVRECLPHAPINDELTILLNGAEHGWGTVGWGVADVRIAPSHSAEIVSQAEYGAAVEVLRRDPQQGWWHIRQRDGYLGWLAPNAVLPGTHETAEAFRATATHVVNNRWLPIYGLEGRQVGLLPWGTPLPIVEFREAQAFFVAPDGQPCSIEADRLIPLDDRPAATTEGVAELMTLLEQFVGVPYLWGGTTAFGFDCSGLVQTAYRFIGCQLSRDADQQFQCGEPVEQTAIQTGDLLFWSGNNPEPDRAHAIDHVTIALDGEQMIHANQSRWSVSIDPIAALQTRYLERGGVGLLGVRRVIQS